MYSREQPTALSARLLGTLAVQAPLAIGLRVVAASMCATLTPCSRHRCCRSPIAVAQVQGAVHPVQ